MASFTFTFTANETLASDKRRSASSDSAETGLARQLNRPQRAPWRRTMRRANDELSDKRFSDTIEADFAAPPQI